MLGMIPLLLAGCALNRIESADKAASTPGTSANPIAVTGVTVELDEVPLYTEATGSFVAEESSNVAP